MGQSDYTGWDGAKKVCYLIGKRGNIGNPGFWNIWKVVIPTETIQEV